MEYHREFTYFLKEYGLNNLGAVEKTPGVPPSAGRLARVSIQAKNQKVFAVLAAKTSPSGITKKFQEMSNITVIKVPLSILRHGSPSNYKDLQIHLAKQLLKVK